ncbi:xanthine dehydrogenase small subunit [Rhodovulum sp. 12E13]|uniref:xanthine dehydrogenase small subunit n=1 Tax=Rhodovulum sp. 12E13 TaxID=2203891 RepID=UPI000E1B0C02|nr:xanthine dehydrogenase small subunit [Rhodovulum sp. 12E13]RDC72816.1 xanthine dehydrogenase small subunit [Rhodovulum sp. 12E13]
MEIAFVLNGAPVRIDTTPTRTLLDWLREERALTGTKEGCNEGDCGACTVIVTGPDGTPRALNACILFLPQLHGKAVRTVEVIAGPDGALHPVQQAMVEHHGSQCGFCTPGFVVAMAAAHARGRTDHEDQLAGNLCRCTGYAPILRAARAAEGAPIPAWVAEDAAAARNHARQDTQADDAHPVFRPDISSGERGDAARGAESPPPTAPDAALPKDSDALAAWYEAHPDATLIAGATDVGLWVTKQLRDLAPVAFLHRCRDLARIEVSEREVRIGAMATLAELHEVMAPLHPSFAELIRRYGSVQVRNAATVGGNIANGSPIGDSPPALIALGATLHLRKGDARRSLPLEDFFVDYGKQDRAPGEFVEAVSFPRRPDTLSCQKLSKRFDQDISAVCGCFDIAVEDDTVTRARVAFGGMAATPKRARAVEATLEGQPWTAATVEAAMARLADDFRPIDDMRASAGYRLRAAQNMLARVFAERAGARTSVLEIAP